MKLFTHILESVGLIKPSKLSKPVHVTEMDTLTGTELFSFYQKNGDQLSIERGINSGDVVTVYSYALDVSIPEEASQKLTSVRSIEHQNLESEKSRLAVTHQWQADVEASAEQLIFLQIRPLQTDDELTLLDFIHCLGDEISEVLEENKLGEWEASDIGPGGGNILFTSSDFSGCYHAITSILSSKGILERSIIGRRLNEDSENWFYEVIFPHEFTGEFLTL